MASTILTTIPESTILISSRHALNLIEKFKEEVIELKGLSSQNSIELFEKQTGDILDKKLALINKSDLDPSTLKLADRNAVKKNWNSHRLWTLLAGNP